jgi:hypothetical protein
MVLPPYECRAGFIGTAPLASDGDGIEVPACGIMRRTACASSGNTSSSSQLQAARVMRF